MDRRIWPILVLGIALVVIAAILLSGNRGSGSASPSPGESPAAASPSSSAAASGSASAPASAPSAAPSVAALPQGSDAIDLDPTLFEGGPIDNPFWPMAVGSRWLYSETDAEGGAEQQVEVTVTDQTKEIIGIRATVVHDVVSAGGEVVEDTLDWYAQDTSGNVWYLGEDTKEYENGEVVSTEGSWEAGVDGALPGIIMPADPQVGMTYRQEFYAGHAEDSAEILALDEQVDVPAGTFDGCLRTREFTPLDPEFEEEKSYCPDVGPTQAVQTKGGTSVERLTEFTLGS